MYQALYRKWRPKIFEDVFGQSHVTGTLKNQIINKKLSHAYLFSGTRGTGKTSCAKILARAVNCENPVDGNPCNNCYACKSALSGSAVDIIEMDAASNNKVEDARMIRDEVIYTPSELKYKVYIIDEAHMLTTNAFNALLKTLEEPPAHIIFIFATTEPQKFPQTILSRCQRFDFKRITSYDIEKRIRQILEAEGSQITDDAVNLVVRVADGSMRDALSLLDQCVAMGGKNITAQDVAEIAGVSDPGFIHDFASAIINGNTTDAIKLTKQAYDKGFDLKTALGELIGFFRNVMIAKSLTDKKTVAEIISASESEIRLYVKTAEELSLERILRYIDVLEKAVSSSSYMGNPRLALEVALLGMIKKPDITTPDGLWEKIAELENKIKRLEKGYTPKEIPAIAEEIPTEASSNEVLPVNEEAYENPVEEVFDYPVAEEEFIPEQKVEVEADYKGEISEIWGDVLISAEKNSLTGFDTMIKSAKVCFSENAVELFFDNESFLNIAKMNKFDENIANAYKAVGGLQVAIKLKLGEPKAVKDDNFSYLIKKLRDSGNDEYIV